MAASHQNAEGAAEIFDPLRPKLIRVAYRMLGSVADASLPQVLAKLIADHNFFHGVNLAVLAQFFRTDPVVAPHVTALEMVPPWLWNLGPRVYAVCALTFRIRGDSLSKT